MNMLLFMFSGYGSRRYEFNNDKVSPILRVSVLDCLTKDGGRC